jgi:hypothetical protein
MHLLMTKKTAIPFHCRAWAGEMDGKYKAHPMKLLGGCTDIRLVIDLVEAAKAETGSKILFCPANKSNQLIDFLYKDEEHHFHAFHVTLRHRHDAKVSDIKQLEDAIGDASKLSIYYAVPDFNFPTFVTALVDPKEASSLRNVFHVMIPNPTDFPDILSDDNENVGHTAQVIFKAYTRVLMTKKPNFFLCRANVEEKKEKVIITSCKLLGGCTEIRLATDPVDAAKAETRSKILFHSASESYPLIDFIYKDEEHHFHAFQATLHRRHDTKITDIRHLENAIGDASKLSIYYAVPGFNFPTFVTDPDPKEAGALCNVFHVMIPYPNVLA